jgi:hypothetical protein
MFTLYELFFKSYRYTYPASDRNLEILLAETNTTCNDTMPLTNLTLPISPFHVMTTNPTLPISPFHVMATNPILMTSQYIAQKASPVTTQVNKTAADSLNEQEILNLRTEC